MLNRHKTGLTLAFCSIFACCGQSLATDYYLEADGSGDFATIQAAMNAALDGDTIWLADGTYTGTGNRDVSFSGKQVTVVSENGPESCIIDCQGSAIDPHRAFIFNNGEAVYSHIQGFTITGGIGPDQIDDGGGNMIDYCGGAVLCESASPWIVDCVFVGNQARYGGAISCDQSSPWIFACVFTENNATMSGGAISNRDYSSPLITNTTFDSNENYMSGGALYNYDHSSPSIHFSRFCNNGSVYCNSAGGAVENAEYSSPFLNRCLLEGNQAGSGGAIGNSRYSNPLICNSLFYNNEAHFYVGGAISNYNCASPQVTNCTLVANTSDWSGGGMDSRYDCEPIVTNCIFWDNLGGGGNEISFYYCPAYLQAVNYCTVAGGYPWGTGNSSADPMFLDDAVGDFRLAVGSPCIDSGDKTANSQIYDYIGLPRCVDDPYTTDTGVGTPAIDRGIYEYGDCNNNQSPDTDDITYGTSEDCNENGYPDECDIELSFANDCNNNGIPDDCDVDDGVVPDCNTNGIPDSCDIAGDTSNDCNNNGVPDECDVADSTSRDINHNSIPDECENISCFSADMVFVYDTSGSMTDVLNSLRSSTTYIVSTVQMELEFTYSSAMGYSTRYTISPSSGKSEPVASSALLLSWDGDIYTLYGSTPGLTYPLSMNEDWAPAVSVLSTERNWVTDCQRIVVTFSDEAPYRGGDVDQYDIAAAAEANGIAISNQVAVIPIIVNNSSQSLLDVAEDLADGTSRVSTAFSIDTSQPGWEEDVITHILETCLVEGHG